MPSSDRPRAGGEHDSSPPGTFLHHGRDEDVVAEHELIDDWFITGVRPLPAERPHDRSPVRAAALLDPRR
jgi:hypothetical protein